MPLILTLLPIKWARRGGAWGEPVAYSVYGLPGRERVISIAPGGWQVVFEKLSEFDHGRVYSSAEDAAAALKAWIEGGKKSPTAED